ncbi:hypothetical protein GCM10010232_66190 [Streptomyces amakusaensis]
MAEPVIDLFEVVEVADEDDGLVAVAVEEPLRVGCPALAAQGAGELVASGFGEAAAQADAVGDGGQGERDGGGHQCGRGLP